MTLREWIDTLEAAPPGAVVVGDQGWNAGWLDSWRGVYAQLTLTRGTKPLKVSALLADARAAVGKTFEGYKGGDFVMGLDTAVWADDYGECDRRMLLGSRVSDDKLVLVTAVMPQEYSW